MILPYRGKWPKINETAFIAGSADVIGDVELGENSSVWFQCVVRGDVHWIKIGARTNIQDHAVLHVTRAKSPLTVGDDVTVGHRVTLHGCTIGHRVLIGMGAIVMDDAQVGEDSIIGAGTLVTKGAKIPPRTLVLGSPGRVTRTLTEKEIAHLRVSASNYQELAVEYRGVTQGPKRLGNENLDLETMDDLDVEFEGGDIK